jgi:pimeloyl-ACP methyl ester carboxylesterase
VTAYLLRQTKKYIRNGYAVTEIAAVSGAVGAMADHVQAFLDTLGTHTCELLGISLGGIIAREVALGRLMVFHTHSARSASTGFT